MELLLGASVIIMAIMLLPYLALKTTLGIILISSFALLHGLAHGNEIIALTLQGSLTAAAVALTTGFIYSAGYWLGIKVIQLPSRQK